MTASPISDLNPVLMAARCTMVLAAAGGIIRSIIYLSTYNSLARRFYSHARLAVATGQSF